MDLRRLRYFLAVADNLHFGETASRLGITQPALSQQIKRLEQEMGTALLDRSNRKIILTAAGLAAMDPFRRCVSAYDDAALAVRDVAKDLQPRLRIGLPRPEAGLLPPEFLHSIAYRFPELRIEIVESMCLSQSVAIREGRIDAGFIHSSVATPDLAAIVVRREELVVLLPRGHPCAAQERVHIENLEEEPFIDFQLSCPAYAGALDELLRHAGFTPRTEYGSTGLSTTIEMVESRLGVAIVPGSAIRGGQHRVVARRLDPPRKELRLAFVWLRDNTSPLVQKLHLLIREMLAPRAIPEPARSRGG